MKIALLPGDGIGPEVMQSATAVLSAVAQKYNHSFQYTEALIGGAAYDEYGEHCPQETLELCKQSDAVLFGSVGGPVDAQSEPKWHNCERNSLLTLRKELDLAVNLRPAVVHPFLAHLCPLKPEVIGDGVDMLIVRELIGGIYFGDHSSGIENRESRIGKKVARDVMEYSESQIKVPVEFAFTAAQQRRKKLTVVDKANVLECSRLWRSVAEEVAPEFSDVELEYLYIDNAVMQVIKNPSQFDVVVTGNMFGDIFSDAASVLPGSLGLMPSASLGDRVHLYEPAGGSAPDIAGRGICNPIAQILSAALMLRYSFGLEEEAQAIEKAVQAVLQSGLRTGDIAQHDEAAVGTSDMTEAIVERL